MEPKKRQQITVQVKAELCIYKKNNPTATHEQLAAKFGISSRKTVTGILHDSDKWIRAGEEAEFDQSDSQKKKLRGCEFPKLDNAVKLWFSQCRSNRITPTDALIIEKALHFSNRLGINSPTDKKFAASDGWLYRFKQRHQIRAKPYGDPDPETVDCPLSRNTFLKTIADEYKPEDVFKSYETGLFYRMAPNKTLTEESGMDSPRLTVLLTCNASGTEKLRPLIIGTVAKPKCFKHGDMSNLPHVQYFHNKKAWMRGDIFKRYVLLLNRRLKEDNRKCLLLLDHSTPRNVQEYEDQLTNLKVQTVPNSPNATFHMRPADNYIVQSFKAKYKSRYVKYLLDDFKKTGNHPLNGIGKFNLRQAINTVVQSWSDVSLGTIRDGWKNGVLTPPVIAQVSPDVSGVRELADLLGQIPSHDVHRVMDAKEYLGVDDMITTVVTLSDEDIIAEVCSASSQEDVEVKVEDDEEEEVDADADDVTPVSWTQMKSAVGVLLKGLEQKAAVYGRAEQLHEELRHFVGFVGKVEKTVLSAMIGQQNDASFKENHNGAKLSNLDRSNVNGVNVSQTCKTCIQVKGERDYLFRKLEEEVTKKLYNQDGKITGKCTDSGAKCPHMEMLTEAISEIARLNQTILELTRREAVDECVMPVHEFVEVTYGNGENETESPRENTRPHIVTPQMTECTEPLSLVKRARLAQDYSHDRDRVEDQPQGPENLVCRWDESGESRFCGEMFPTVKDLTTHVTAHVTNSWATTQACCWEGCSRNRHPYQFTASLMHHIYVHTGQVPYRCPRKGCGMMFTRYNQLKKHKRKHGKYRRFLCKYPNCGVDFTSPSGLVVHVRRDHTDEKPYGCHFDGCGEMFVTKMELNHHVRTHADEAKEPKDLDETVT